MAAKKKVDTSEVDIKILQEQSDNLQTELDEITEKQYELENAIRHLDDTISILKDIGYE